MALSNGILNGCPTVTVSSDPWGYPGSNCIDGDTSTFWHTDSGVAPYWIKFDLGAGNEKVGGEYFIQSRDSGEHEPVDFLWQASNNDLTWVTLDSQTDITDWTSPPVKKSFPCLNTTAYRYYRLYVTATVSTYCCIAEIGAALGVEVKAPACYIKGSKRNILETRSVSFQNSIVSSGGSFEDIIYTDIVNITSIEDGEMVVIEGNNITINANTIVTTENRCKGIKIIAHGNFICNGILTMTARGPYTEPADVVVANPFDDGNLYTIPSAGADGGASITGESMTAFTGNVGSNGTNRQSGGGGGGAMWHTPGDSGTGADGTSYGGGSGGGGNSSNGGGGDAQIWGGAGGVGDSWAGGGAGNPLGTGGSGGENGIGGLIIIIVRGDIIIGSDGAIYSKGSRGSENGGGAGGAGSGGGSINISYGLSYTNNGEVSAEGGDGGLGYDIATGGKGGNGCITVESIPNLDQIPYCYISSSKRNRLNTNGVSSDNQL